MQKNILEDFRKRGILKQISNEDKFNNLKPNSGVYIGFDPTAQSLHLGNYIQIVNLLRFKSYGFKVYAVLGGATGMIGDPSFKDSERKLLDNQTILNNKKHIKQQLEKFGLEVIDNYDFYKNTTFLDFLRDAGKLVNISYMLAKDSISKRINSGLSFTEFTYTLIQGWDFLTLYKNYGVQVQFGGSDQWGNITTGLDMISKVEGDKHTAVAGTFNLLTDENGNKFGKSTGGGSLWLDKNMNSPYNLYQFLLNQSDAKVEELLKWLTLLSLEEIEQTMQQHNLNPSLRVAQKKLAFEVVKDVHDKKEATKAFNISQILFNKKFDIYSLSLQELEELKDNLKFLQWPKQHNIVELLISNQIVKSKREVREFIATQALKLNDLPIDESTLLTTDKFENKYAILKKGKKDIFVIELI
ncbi:tyrosine--tRNA ligase [Mycoplasmopsis ciconiae]|uniref:Tyrosine--tRNA ligase n=1 Tax=Mycoplasmopsis ciconiae TaxID=561067 RepID=A0ABU7MMC7_9BACT|nr:tyrosine--tRNA ligase [Mycoplasmopsis ciconiae]